MFNKKEETTKKKVVKADKVAFSEKILEKLNSAKDMLKRSPQSLEVRGAEMKLSKAIAALMQAGKFAEVKKNKED